MVTLNPAAQVALASCEQRIERGLKTFIDVGQALAEIRDSRLYKGTHETFEAYLEGRWGMSRAHAYRMISAAEVVSPMGDTEALPTNERQTRELAKVPEAERADVWRKTVERTDGKPTAAAIREVHEERTRPQFPGPADPTTSPTGSGSPATPPPGSPATWTDEQREANRLEVERKAAIAACERAAESLVLEVRGMVTTIIDGLDNGAPGIPVTLADIDECRAALDRLEARVINA